ncbi:cytochrome c oxidase assembly factor CtaG [Halalkalibacter lacteus]|uniref:cytochrome c oxidase assembly factor CtaG n=1 Tax=Halalkalibacter lacteus TaxID=3090663 RepID=UPI002FC69F9B
MDVLIENFGFRALWTPELVIGLLFVLVLYFLFVTKWRHRIKDAAPVSVKQKVYFVLALLALYIGWGSPLYVAGHIMISFHMTQMVFAYFIATPLLLLGIPSWFFQALIDRFRTPFTERVFRVIWSPIVALFLFNGLFSFYHVPFMFDTLMQSVVLHSFYEYLLLFASALMWWHMIAPLPSSFALSDLRRVGYIFANGILITPACALIIFAPTTLYQTYTDPTIWATVMAYCLPAGAEVPMGLFSGPDSFAVLETRMDQQLAGVLMKIMQEVAYGFTIGYVFKQWLKKEKQQDGALTISDIPTAKT